MEHLYVNFGDPSCIGFWGIVRINRQTDRQTQRQTQMKSLPPWLPSMWVKMTKVRTYFINVVAKIQMVNLWLSAYASRCYKRCNVRSLRSQLTDKKKVWGSMVLVGVRALTSLHFLWRQWG